MRSRYKITEKEGIYFVTSTIVEWIPVFTTFKKRNKKASNFQVWQEGFHPQLILNDKMLIQKVEYIHHNPVRSGLVEEPEHWRYSSARNYHADDHSIIKTDELPV